MSLDEGGQIAAGIAVYILLVIGAMIGCGFGARALMKGKGRSGAAGFCLGFFLGLPGVLIAGLLSPTPEYEVYRMRRQMELMGMAVPAAGMAPSLVSPSGQFVAARRSASNPAIGWSIAAGVVLLAWVLTEYGLNMLRGAEEAIAPFLAATALMIVGSVQAGTRPARAGLAVGAAAVALATTVSTLTFGRYSGDAYFALIPTALCIVLLVSLRGFGAQSGGDHADLHRALLIGAGAAMALALIVQAKSGRTVKGDMWPGWVLQTAVLVGVLILAGHRRSEWWRMAALGVFGPLALTVIAGLVFELPEIPAFLLIRQPHLLTTLAVIFAIAVLVVAQRQAGPAPASEVLSPATVFQGDPRSSVGLVAPPSAPPPVAPVAPAAQVANPARWATDPLGRHEQRYWDGSRWTEHVADLGVTSTDDGRAPQAPPAADDGATVPSRPPAVASAAREPAAELVFDSGSRVSVTTTMVIGRAPRARPEAAGAVLVVFDDSTMSVSATHLLVGPDASGVWVEDAGSTNGSSVRLPSGQSMQLVPGLKVTVPFGAELHLGDRTARVVRPEEG